MAFHLRRIALAGTLACSLAIAFYGCNASGGNSAPAPNCTLPPGAQIALVYPAPGSTGNTSLLSQVIVASNVQLSSSFDIVLTYSPSAVYGQGQYGGYLAPASAPFPTPNATPSFANPYYYSSTFNTTAQQLPPGQSIAVNYNDVSSTCNPTAFASFGT